MCYFDQKGKVGRSGGETTKAGRAKLYAKLKAEDIVAMEVNSLAFVMEKEMRKIGCTVVILNPSQLSVIYASTKKTDAAWAIVRSSHGGALKAKYFYMTEHGKGKKISITAIARKKSEINVSYNEE